MFKTLQIYFGRNFILNVIGVFSACFMLVFIVDFLEMMRKIGDIPNLSGFKILLLSLTRVPFFAELILPFSVLIASIICFITFSKKLEFVVARAAGISAWQFLAPALLLAVLVGCFSSFVYNPVAVNLREYGINKEAEILQGRSVSQTGKLFMRQQSGTGQAVITALSGSNQGQSLNLVIVYRFDSQNRFIERLDAASAALVNGFWHLKEVQITALNQIPKFAQIYELPTSLTEAQVRDSFVSPDMVPFWKLNKFIEITENSGLSATRFKLQYHALLARPLLLVAMVLLAAAASLKFFRMGGIVQTIIFGVLTGFLLYIGGELANNLGRSGFLDPMIAGWAPSIIGCLVGFRLLLIKEDG